MNVHFSTLQCVCCDECTSLLFPRPASSTSAGNLPHFPEWLWTTPRERARPCHIQFWVWTVHVGGESDGDVEQNVFPVKRVVPFPTCLKAAFCIQGSFKLLLLVENFPVFFCHNGFLSVGVLTLVEKVPALKNVQNLQLQRFNVTALESVLWNPRGGCLIHF